MLINSCGLCCDSYNFTLYTLPGKSCLNRYRREDLDISGGLKVLSVSSVLQHENHELNNLLVTFMEVKELALRENVRIRFNRLNHARFQWKMELGNPERSRKRVIVRIFIVLLKTPGDSSSFTNKEPVMMDKFAHNLSGEEKETLVRESTDNTLSMVESGLTVERLSLEVGKRETSTWCGLPINLYLPKSSEQGRDFLLMAFVHDVEQDVVEGLDGVKHVMCGHKNIETKMDSRSYGFPFDREFDFNIHSSNNRLSSFAHQTIRIVHRPDIMSGTGAGWEDLVRLQPRSNERESGRGNGTNVGGNNTTTLGGDNPTTVGGNNSTTVGGNNQTTVGGNNPTTVGGSNRTTVGGNNPTTMGENNRTTVEGNNPTTVGESNRTTVGGDNPTTLGENNRTTVEGNNPTTVGGNNRTTVGGNNPTTVGGNNRTTEEDPANVETSSPVSRDETFVSGTSPQDGNSSEEDSSTISRNETLVNGTTPREKDKSVDGTSSTISTNNVDVTDPQGGNSSVEGISTTLNEITLQQGKNSSAEGTSSTISRDETIVNGINTQEGNSPSTDSKNKTSVSRKKQQGWNSSGEGNSSFETNAKRKNPQGGNSFAEGYTEETSSSISRDETLVNGEKPQGWNTSVTIDETIFTDGRNETVVNKTSVHSVDGKSFTNSTSETLVNGINSQGGSTSAKGSSSVEPKDETFIGGGNQGISVKDTSSTEPCPQSSSEGKSNDQSAKRRTTGNSSGSDAVDKTDGHKPKRYQRYKTRDTTTTTTTPKRYQRYKTRDTTTTTTLWTERSAAKKNKKHKNQREKYSQGSKGFIFINLRPSLHCRCSVHV